MLTSSSQRTIGIFGGTFDPVHRAHITLAEQLRTQLALDEMRLLPCRLPPHRDQPTASDSDRLHMLRLACTGTNLLVDDRELHREGPSYTIDTLQSLRKEYGDDVSLVLCMGMDAFIKLHTWHRWQDLLSLSHIAVMQRPSTPDPVGEVAVLLAHHKTTDKQQLKSQPAGLIYLTQLDEIPVSSTQVRQQLSKGQQPLKDLHPAVIQFIQQRGLYLTR